MRVWAKLLALSKQKFPIILVPGKFVLNNLATMRKPETKPNNILVLGNFAYTADVQTEWFFNITEKIQNEEVVEPLVQRTEWIRTKLSSHFLYSKDILLLFY